MRRRDQHPAAAPALRRRRPAAPRRGRRPVVHHLPGVGENLQDHLEVYIQYASKQPVSIAPGLRWHKRPGIGYQWLFHRRGLGATNHFEGGGFARSNDDVDYPNLMFHFLPVAIRYDGTAPTEGHGYQVHIGPDVRRHPRPRQDRLDATPSSTRRCCSTTCRRRTTGASGSRRSGWRATSSTSRPSRRTTTASSRPARRVETDEEILDWVRADAETALHPSCTAADGRRRDVGRRPRDDAGARRRGPAGRRRVGLPLRHQRQHLRPRDDGGREGRRPDPREHPTARGGSALVLASATAARSTRPATAATTRSRHDRHGPAHLHAPSSSRGREPRCTSTASGRSSAPRPTRS